MEGTSACVFKPLKSNPRAAARQKDPTPAGNGFEIASTRRAVVLRWLESRSLFSVPVAGFGGKVKVNGKNSNPTKLKTEASFYTTHLWLMGCSGKCFGEMRNKDSLGLGKMGIYFHSVHREKPSSASLPEH